VPEVGPEIETDRGGTCEIIVIVKLSLAVRPAESLTVTLTVYVPGELHKYVIEDVFPEVPIFHEYV
jgi:hypothetical protein